MSLGYAIYGYIFKQRKRTYLNIPFPKCKLGPLALRDKIFRVTITRSIKVITSDKCYLFQSVEETLQEQFTLHKSIQRVRSRMQYPLLNEFLVQKTIRSSTRTGEFVPTVYLQHYFRIINLGCITENRKIQLLYVGPRNM